MQNKRSHIDLTAEPIRWAIAIGIFYYLLTVNLIGLAHEHDRCHEHDHGHEHEHEHDASSSDHCSACFFIVNHIGVTSYAVGFTDFNTDLSIYSPFDLTCSFTKLATNVRSRAPPMSSIYRTLYNPYSIFRLS